jgi:hypothetical protein
VSGGSDGMEQRSADSALRAFAETRSSIVPVAVPTTASVAGRCWGWPRAAAALLPRGNSAVRHRWRRERTSPPRFPAILSASQREDPPSHYEGSIGW